MREIMNKNKQVYEFLGYNVDEIKYSRQNDNPESIALHAKVVHEHNNILTVKLIITFGAEEAQSLFTYVAGFKIIDEEYRKSLGEQQLLSLFVAVLYPFARESVANITKSVMLPIVDLRLASFKDGVIFHRNRKAVSEEKE